MTIRRRRGPVQGAQYGSGNEQRNYFAPVTQYVFTGGLERLRDVSFDPAPLARELDLARFTGREWLIGQIDAFIANRPRGYVVIQAEAGVGKSTLAAHLAGSRPWPCHFTRLPGGRSPEAARKNLAAQLIAAWDLTEWAPGGVLPVASARPDWFARLLEATARERDWQHPGEDGREPIVLVVDGLDEAGPEPGGERDLPLGLPDSLPDGVFVVTTSRFGLDRALHAVRNPADWLQIEVEGDDNLDDMDRFLRAVTSAEDGDARLVKALREAGVETDWFHAKVARACAGVWIYLRYVLDEIRDGARNPRGVAGLPGDLAGYYAGQVEQWRGAAEDEAAARRWEQVRLPLLGVLGAAQAPLTVAELAGLAAVPSAEAARVFVEESARAFLSRRCDSPGAPRYSLRHQSLRELLGGNIPERPDLDSMARMLAARVHAAHGQITVALTPPGQPGERDWTSTGNYARQHLAAHAAACGALDALINDPGFLLVTEPAALVPRWAALRTPDGQRALAAFELSLHHWDADPAARLDWLGANAARLRATTLTHACAAAGGDWPTRWAAWAGYGHRRLTGHNDPVGTVAVGRAGSRDVIVSGAHDATVQIWDAVTGDPIGAPLAGHGGVITAVAIAHAGDRDVVVSGATDGTARIWDAVTGNPVGVLTVQADRVTAVAIGRAGDRDVIVTGGDDGRVLIWDAVTGNPAGVLASHDDRVYAVTIGRAGDRDVIAATWSDKTGRAWDAVTGDPLPNAWATGFDDWTMGADDEPREMAVAIGRAGQHDVIAVGGPGLAPVRLYDAVTGDDLGGPLTDHESWMTTMAIGRAAGRDIIVFVSGRIIEIWDAVTGWPVGDPRAGHEDQVTAVAIGQAGDRGIVVSSSLDGTMRIWDVIVGDALAGHYGPVNAVAIGKAGSRDIVVSGSDDETLLVWDAITGEPVGDPLDMNDSPFIGNDQVCAVAVGRAAGRDILVAASYMTVKIWDAVTGDHVGDLDTHHGGLFTTAVIGRAAGRDVIVARRDDGSLLIWDAVTGEPVGDPLADEYGEEVTLAIGRAANRDLIVVGTDDGSLRIWDPVTGEPVDHPPTDQDRVTAVAIGRAGGRDVIVASTDDGSLLIWDAVTGESVGHSQAGHHGEVVTLAIGRAANRDLIVAGTDDGSLRIWDAVTCDPVSDALAGHDGPVTAVAMGRAGDQDIIVSVSRDRTVLARSYRGEG
jgi:WD40 repeat protein